MEILVFLVLAAFLVFLNGFFVLAEFSAVKVRATQIQILAEKGDKLALRAHRVIKNLDVYLSVCQVGITVASIGLGFVGEPAFGALLHPVIEYFGHGWLTEMAVGAVAVTLGFLIVSFLHIVLGELLPKSIAIRSAEKSILLVSGPLFFFRLVFAGPIWFLNATVNGILRMFGVPRAAHAEAHSDDEIRAILDHSQTSGVLSFRSLLLLENVLDFGQLTVRNAMRVRRLVQTLSLPLNRAQAVETMAATKYSRYPVLSPGGQPVGFLHVKDVLFASPEKSLEDLIRPCLRVAETDGLEKVLSVMQRKAQHLALVQGPSGLWTGIITLEDIVEELTGTIEEEYPVEPSVNLMDFLAPAHIVLDVEGTSIGEAVTQGLAKVADETLPCSRAQIVQAVVDRERLGSSYLGHHLAVPHARIDGVRQPAVFVFRVLEPLPAPTGKEGQTIRLLFLLVTPATAHRVHQVLLSHLGGMYDSDYFEDRLLEAPTAQDLYDTVATVELSALG